MEISGEPLTGIPEESIIKMIYENGKSQPDLLFCTDGVTGQKYSYGDLFDKSVRVAAHLNGLGIGKGDVVTVATRPTFQGMTVAVGTWFSGASFNPINPQLTTDDIKQMLLITKPKLIYSEGKNPNVEQARTMLGSTIPLMSNQPSDSSMDLNEWMKTTVTDFKLPDISSRTHVMYVLFTSGTTGVPKGIQLRDECFKVLSRKNILGKTDKSYLLTSPMFWISNPIIITSTLSSAKSLIVPRFPIVEKEILEVIHKYKPTSWFAGPSLTLSLLQEPNLQDYDLSSVNSMLSAGAQLLGVQRRQLNEVLFKNRLTIKHVYGSTESGMMTTWDDNIDTDSEEYESVGRPSPGVRLKIVDLDTGASLGPLQHGEICVKTATIMAGVMTMSGITTEGIDDEGWLHTGDVGYYDHQHLLYVVSRCKDIMKYRSYQIAPAEIENILYTHPDIQECCVSGKPDPVCGDLPTAFIVLKPGISSNQDQIAQFINEQVSDFKKLRGGIYFVEALPKSSVGKLLRRTVKEALVNADQNQIELSSLISQWKP